MCISFLTMNGSGIVITVDDDADADFTKIQDAIDASEDGDTIRVHDGDYQETIRVEKSIDLIGNGSETTSIGGSGFATVLYVSATWSNISGFHITGSGKWVGNSGIQVNGENITLTNNTLTNNTFGIYIDNAKNCILEHNIMYNNGIYLSGTTEEWTSHNIGTSNTVNGKPVAYHNNDHGSIVSLGAGQVILANCSQMIVEDQICMNATTGIMIGHSNNITIKNNVCSSNYYQGIWLHSSRDCIVVNNVCSSNTFFGIELTSSSDCTIEENSCFSNKHFGIYLFYSRDSIILDNICSMNEMDGISVEDSRGCIIEKNVCEENYQGIRLYSLFIFYDSYSTRCTVRENVCMNNEIGIKVRASSDCVVLFNRCINNQFGISLDRSSDYIIKKNHITGNNITGIYLERSTDSSITFNIIADNGMGIHAEKFSRDNSIQFNDITNNSHFGINASKNNDHIIHAMNNWWGTDSGPFHPTNNSEGEGDVISDFVEFDPWLDSEARWPPEAYIDSVYPDPAIEGESIRFVGHGIDDGSIARYAWRSSLDGDLHNSTDPVFETTGLSFGDHSIYFMVQDDHGIWSEEVSTTLSIIEYIPANQEPTILVTSPANNSEISGVVTFVGIANDPDGTVQEVKLSINGGDWIIVEGVGDWNYTWDTNAFNNGTYEIRVLAYDGEEYSRTIIWNLEVNNEAVPPDDKDDNGEGDDRFLPGFDILAVVSVIGIGLLCSRKKQH